MKKTLVYLCIAGMFVTACQHSSSLVVSTYAGNGSIGAKDGAANEASFSNLMGLAIDSANNIYVADSRNNLIRKVSADGTVSTLAGSGKVGSADGKGNAASFFFPTAIAVGTNGMVYVADTHNSLIRKITPDGTVTTIAGRIMPVPHGATQASVQFDNPAGIAVDKAGNVYVSDWAKDMIRKISPDGKIVTVAGTGKSGSNDGVGSSASFFLPAGIAIDGKGDLFVADSYNNRVRKISPDGMVSTLITGKPVPHEGPAKRDTSMLSHPYGITLDNAGNLYVADVGNSKIRKITPAGKMVTFAGNGKRGTANGAANQASFYHPYGVVADNKGDIYVADYQNNIIRKISL
jgi:sugar lactone lactonase YvrE